MVSLYCSMLTLRLSQTQSSKQELLLSYAGSLHIQTEMVCELGSRYEPANTSISSAMPMVTIAKGCA